MATTTTCRFCRKEIQPDARTCEHCGERLDDALTPPKTAHGLPDVFAFGAPGGGGLPNLSSIRLTQRNVIIAAGVALAVALAAVTLSNRHASSPVPVPVAGPRFPIQNTPDNEAHSRLRNTLVAAKVMYTTGSTYARADASATGLVTVDPALCYVDAATPSVSTAAVCASGTGDASVSVYHTKTVFAAAAMSASGRCWLIRDEAAVGTTYGEGAECTGAAAAQEATSSAFPA